MSKFIAVVDCNNFFVSCERLINPKIANKPVIVLSNNDGCIVSRSNEAKELGFKMGEPFFKCREKINKYNVSVFSSNFSLYVDISKRIVKLLKSFSFEIEEYSIDESFLDLSSLSGHQLIGFARKIRIEVLNKIGIPVSVGIGPTKTLAKVACKIAKKEKNGIYIFDYSLTNCSILKSFPIEDIWGIGRQSSKLLKFLNIRTAFDFLMMDPIAVKKYFGVNGLRTQLEFKGTVCIKLESKKKPRKSIQYARSFGKEISSYSKLLAITSSFTDRACAKLRSDGLLASMIAVFLMKNRFKNFNDYFFITTKNIGRFSNYTPDFLIAAEQCLKMIYKKNSSYKKVGVYLFSTVQRSCEQLSLLNQIDNSKKDRYCKLMKTFDSINYKWGNGTIKFLVEADNCNCEELSKNAFVSKNNFSDINNLTEIKI